MDALSMARIDMACSKPVSLTYPTGRRKEFENVACGMDLWKTHAGTV